MTQQLNLPKFFNYKEEGTDNGYETIQDFFLSWTLRSSVDKNSKANAKVQSYSKQILLAMLFGFNNDSDKFEIKPINEEIDIISVVTKRQWNFIDLLAEVELRINGETKFYLLNIENKWYSSIRPNQLENSKSWIENEYNIEKWNIVNAIVFCDGVKLNTEIRKICKKQNFKLIIIEDLFDFAISDKTNLTGNYLFDEYWFKF